MYCTATPLVLQWSCAGTALALRWVCNGTTLTQCLQLPRTSQVLLWYCTGDALMPYWYYTCATVVLHWNCTGAAVVLHKDYTGTTMVVVLVLCSPFAASASQSCGASELKRAPCWVCLGGTVQPPGYIREGGGEVYGDPHRVDDGG